MRGILLILLFKMFLVMRIKRKLAGLHVEDTKQTNHFYCCPESCNVEKEQNIQVVLNES